jgi:hypothetical protein
MNLNPKNSPEFWESEDRVFIFVPPNHWVARGMANKTPILVEIAGRDV